MNQLYITEKFKRVDEQEAKTSWHVLLLGNFCFTKFIFLLGVSLTRKKVKIDLDCGTYKEKRTSENES